MKTWVYTIIEIKLLSLEKFEVFHLFNDRKDQIKSVKVNIEYIIK